MPEQPAQTIPSASALTDAEAIDGLDDLVLRAVACLVAAVIAFLLVALPIPFASGYSVAQIFIVTVTGSISEARLCCFHPRSGFEVYWYVCLALTFVLIHPVVLKHALDIATPVEAPGRWRALRATLLGCCSCFLVGVFICVVYLLNPLIERSVSSQWTWWPRSFGDLMFAISAPTLTAGFACELPALMFGAVWLRITNPERLAVWRPYVVLGAFIVAAWITPTPDALNQAIVAIPVYLLYELGLLLAHLVPADNEPHEVAT